VVESEAAHRLPRAPWATATTTPGRSWSAPPTRGSRRATTPRCPRPDVRRPL